MTRNNPQRPSSGRKQRQAILAQWQVEIVRGGADQIALERIRQRALHDRQVRDDPDLAAQIEQCIRERSNEIKRLRGTQEPAASQAHAPHISRYISYDPTQRDILKIVERLRVQAREQLARHDEMAASFTLERLKSLMHDYPDVIDEAIIRPLLESHAVLKRRRREISDDIEILANTAANAAASGDHDAAAAAMRQLSAHHIAHPDILGDDAMDAIRERVLLAGARLSHEQAARDLMRREREVSDELRALRTAIRDYRQSAHADPHDSAAYRFSERAYRNAVRQVRHHDREWLAGTILELVGLLDDWEDHPRSADNQVDNFVRTLKSTLKQLHDEVRAAEKLRRGE